MKKNLAFFLAGLLFTIVALTCIRFVTFKDDTTHFHANFAVYLNGKRFDFAQDKYMEEVSACTLTKEVLPKQRAHMHNKVGDLVHVHDHGVTWGHFFTNINWSIGKDYIIDDANSMYKAGDINLVKYVLNGQFVSNVSNTLIKSEDSLLVSFGPETDEKILEEYNSIAKTAHTANETKDPATCSGTTPPTFMTKLKKSFIN